MTLPDERYRALRQLPGALVKLATDVGPVRKRNLRHLVRMLLRHYPLPHEVDRLADRCPELLQKEGAR